MANTFTSLHYHIVFSTKNRETWIRQDAQERVWDYLGGIARENDLKPLIVGGVEDHVHMLVEIPPTIALSEALQRLKGGSSRWLKQNIPYCRGFGWQDGYGAFTVSKSQEPHIKRYIQNQREHHRKQTFQEEYRQLLNRHGISYDERYLLD
ncbi:MAG TPA: IS200/IS605 family transposase [Verrucomicrobiae bacterium]|nr:IS200/IS605 family transposase [Verrucomicrobiae bacterium]